MKYVYILLLILLAQSKITAQGFQVYQADELNFYSNNWNDTISCTLSLPLSMQVADTAVRYPLLLIFDQQNATTFHYHLQTINFLTGVGAQIPDLVVAGLPFDPDKRWMNTSLKKQADDSISGIALTAKMIFDELLPQLKAKYPVSDYLMIVGHSRTAYLANYLLANFPDQVDMAAAFSGFFEDPETSNLIIKLAQGENNPSNQRHSYYLSAGDSFEEQSYLNEFDEMALKLDSIETSSTFYWKYEVHPHANHISNYGLSLGPVLVDHFSDYNTIIGSWFSDKIDQLNGQEAAESLMADFEALPYPLPLQLLHINSIGSGYYSNQDYLTSEKIIDLGLQFYPSDAGLTLFKADLLVVQGKKSESEPYLMTAKQLLETQDFLSDDETVMLWDWYEAIKTAALDK